jgi:hypothetical protein
MAWLVVAAVVWIGIHTGIAGTSLRGVMVARIGEPAMPV